MGAGINLSIAERMAFGSTEASRFNMGSADWVKPLTNVAAYYGTGVGQVPLDARIDLPETMILDSNSINYIYNQGGAGSYFDLTPAAANRRPVSTIKLATGGGSTVRGLNFANVANLSNINMMVVFKAPGAPAATYNITNPSDVISLTNMSATNYVVTCDLNIGSSVTVPVTFQAVQPHLLRIKILGGNMQIYIDANQVYSGAAPTSLSDLSGFVIHSNWGIGRFLSVILQDGNEPAQDIALNEIAETYGITI